MLVGIISISNRASILLLHKLVRLSSYTVIFNGSLTMTRRDVPTKSLAKSSYVTVAQSPADERNISRNNEVRRRYPSIASRLHVCSTRFFTNTADAARRMVKGAPLEKPKVLATQSKRRAVSVCLIHTLPILASIVLAAMNLKGYYIGAQLQGSSDRSSQAIYILCLQVTAKLLVCSINNGLTSLTSIFCRS